MMPPLLSGLAPRVESGAGAVDECLVRGRSRPPSSKLQIDGCRLGVSRSLRVRQQLFHDARKQLQAGLPLAGGYEAGAADFGQDGRSALLVRAVRDISVQRLDRLQLAPPVEP